MICASKGITSDAAAGDQDLGPPSGIVFGKFRGFRLPGRLRSQQPTRLVDVRRRGRGQLVHAGLVARIALDPVPPAGRTWLKLFFCHWKMKDAAAPFSPSA